MSAADVIHVREGWRLVQTCGVCPEQYDLVDHRGETKAYLRFRWGYFSVICPAVDAVERECVFDHDFGEEYKGSFEPEERDEFLRLAVDAADEWWRTHARGMGS